MLDKIMSLSSTEPFDLIVNKPKRAVEVTFHGVDDGVALFQRRTEITDEDIYISTDNITSIDDSEPRPMVFARVANVINVVQNVRNVGPGENLVGITIDSL